MVNYNKSIIYKLCCKDVAVKDEYVGSTTNFQRRKAKHKCSCNNNNNKQYNYKVYVYIRENGGWDNWDMVEVERYEATDKGNLHSRERYWIETLKSGLNGVIPTRTDKEYYEANKETIQEYRKGWYGVNKEAVQEYKKGWYEVNKEAILEQRKEYYEANKEAILEKVTCECGSVVVKQYLTRHKLTDKHIRLSPPCSPTPLQI